MKKMRSRGWWVRCPPVCSMKCRRKKEATRINATSPQFVGCQQSRGWPMEHWAIRKDTGREKAQPIPWERGEGTNLTSVSWFLKKMKTRPKDSHYCEPDSSEEPGITSDTAREEAEFLLNTEPHSLWWLLKRTLCPWGNAAGGETLVTSWVSDLWSASRSFNHSLLRVHKCATPWEQTS